MNLIDQQRDTAQKMFHQIRTFITNSALKDIVSSYGQFVKQASLSDEKFLLPEQRLFPVNNLSNTALSKLYFDYQRNLVSEKTASRMHVKLGMYLALYDIPENIFPEYQMTKEASGFEFFLLPELKLCKVASTEDVPKAEELFEREGIKLPMEDRVTFSRNLVKAAEAMTIDIKSLSASILKYAGEMDSDLNEVIESLDHRVALVSRSGHSGEAYSKMASELKKVTVAPTKEELCKLAEALCAIDAANNVEKDYDRRIPCPYSVVFNKVAKEEYTVPADLINMPKSDIIGRYGESVLQQVEEPDGKVNHAKLHGLVRRLGIYRKGK